jgi:16S rRNA (uracil1498-N3)-methyltransferase
VVRWQGERAGRALDRLRRVAREAAAQSRRAWLPAVDGILGLSELSAEASPDRLALADPGGAPPGRALRYLAVGPEGGWDEAERSGGALVGLGPRVLRAETAAMAAATILCSLRDGSLPPC